MSDYKHRSISIVRHYINFKCLKTLGQQLSILIDEIVEFKEFIIFNINLKVQTVVMKGKNSRHSSSLCNSRKGSKNITTVDPKILKIYGANNKQKAKNKINHSKIVIKQANTEDSRLDSQTYDFPQFSYIPNVPKSNRTVKYNASKNETNRKNKQTTKISQGKKSYLQDQNLEIRKEFYPDFILSLSKLFKKIDNFSKGVIHKSIIPDELTKKNLKIVGEALQKVKRQNLFLSELQFIKICEPFYNKSLPQDIKGLLIGITSFLQEKKPSKNMIQKENQVESPTPIQLRIAQQQAKKSILKSSMKNSNLDGVLQIIGNQQQVLKDKISSLSDRKKIVSFDIAPEEKKGQIVNLNNQKEVWEREMAKRMLQQSIKKSINFEEKQIIKKPQYQSHNFRQSSNGPNSMESKYPMKKNGLQVGYFNFELPSNNRPNEPINSKIKQHSPQKATILSNYSKPSASYYVQSYRNEFPSFSARGNNSQTQMVQAKQSTSFTNRFVFDEDNSRIDELNRKLEISLTKNRLKIDYSKQFCRDNDVLRG